MSSDDGSCRNLNFKFMGLKTTNYQETVFMAPPLCQDQEKRR
jgi:hypothetical protein